MPGQSSAVEFSPPTCPPAGAGRLSQASGHHKVTLTWNASVPSSDPDDTVVGYCIYRSHKKMLKDPTPATSLFQCTECEQLNAKPVPGTICIDDRVEDEGTYYYVATAISRKHNVSKASNETKAVIRLHHKKAEPKSPSETKKFIPLCRDPDHPK